MKSALAPALLFLASCAQGAMGGGGDAKGPAYAAAGHDPLWHVTVRDNMILLAFGSARPDADKGYVYRGVQHRNDNGARRWESADGTAVIAVEAWRGPCTDPEGAVFEDRVRVRLSGRELNGCGGRKSEDRS